MFWFKSRFSSINTGILYCANIALTKFEYVSIFFVIIAISLYFNFSSLTNSVIFFATFSISEYSFFSKNNSIFLTFSLYFSFLLLYIFSSKNFDYAFEVLSKTKLLTEEELLKIKKDLKNAIKFNNKEKAKKLIDSCAKSLDEIIMENKTETKEVRQNDEDISR